jgi:hypothetical protein
VLSYPAGALVLPESRLLVVVGAILVAIRLTIYTVVPVCIGIVTRVSIRSGVVALVCIGRVGLIALIDVVVAAVVSVSSAILPII